MTRPTKLDINSGIQNWDGKIDDNAEVLFNGPLPIHQHTGDESNLQATFAAVAYERCMVWVDHTVLGWTLYESDGTDWTIRDSAIRESFTFSATTSMTIAHHGAFIRFTGTGTNDFDLRSAALWAGQSVTVRNDQTAGTLNLDPNAAEAINGVSGGPLAIPAGSTASVYSDGAAIWVGFMS